MKEENKEEMRFNSPELSEKWKCYLFGSDEGGIVYTPKKDYEPNIIIRFFMRILLDCKWIKE